VPLVIEILAKQHKGGHFLDTLYMRPALLPIAALYFKCCILRCELMLLSLKRPKLLLLPVFDRCLGY